MKSVPFEYIRPNSAAEVCELLAADEDAQIIAGGQTLVPMMTMRLARPSKLIDVMRLPELSGLHLGPDHLTIGATTLQVDAEHSELVAANLPLLHTVLPWVGHPPTRNRGTIGGSIANADPSAEIALVAMTLEAEIAFVEKRGEAVMSTEKFLLGPMSTALPPATCLRAIRFPLWKSERIGVGFHEVSARKSDFAFVSAAAQIALDADGRCIRLAAGIGGVGDRPLRFDVTQLVGSRLQECDIREVVQIAARRLEATSDQHASAAYRRRVAEALGVRAITSALADAGRKEATA